MQRQSAVVISHMPFGSSASREGDRLPPWRGSLHMPQQLPSQKTHHFLTGDKLAVINIPTPSERVEHTGINTLNMHQTSLPAKPS